MGLGSCNTAKLKNGQVVVYVLEEVEFSADELLLYCRQNFKGFLKVTNSCSTEVTGVHIKS